MPLVKRSFVWMVFAAAIIAAGCRGGGNAGSPMPPAAQRTMHPDPGGRGFTAHLVLTIPKGALAPNGMGGAFYSFGPSTDIFGKFAADVSATSALCKTSSTGRICTVNVQLNVSGDVLGIQLYSVKPVKGALPKNKQIGGGYAHPFIDAKNDIFLTTATAVAKLTARVSKPFWYEMYPTTQQLYVGGYDKDGKIVVSNAFTSGTTKVSLGVSADDASAPALLISSAKVGSPGAGALSFRYDSSKPTPSMMQNGFNITFTIKPHVSSIKSFGALLPMKTPFINEQPIQVPSAYPQRVVTGRDGSIWFVSNYNPPGEVSRYDKDFGSEHDYTGFNHPQTLAIGSDANLWVADWDGNSQITRITPGDLVTHFTLPVNTYPAGISAGPNGDLWFASEANNYVSYVSPTIAPSASPVAQIPLASASNSPLYSVEGDDGNEYFVLWGTKKIAQVPPSGTGIQYFTIPGASPDPQDIVLGPDHNLWFADIHSRTIYSMTTGGIFTGYPVKLIYAPVGPLAFGPDGKIWFPTTQGTVARLDPVYKTTIAFTLPNGNSGFGIAYDPIQGFIYVTETTPPTIARMK